MINLKNLSHVRIFFIFASSSNFLFFKVKYFIIHYSYVKEKKIKIKLANKKLIQQIKELLSQLFIDSGKIRKDENSYLINICGFKDIKTFSDFIGFTHKTKRNKIIRLLNSYKYLAWTKK